MWIKVETIALLVLNLMFILVYKNKIFIIIVYNIRGFHKKTSIPIEVL